ncbi:MAG TPA: diaminopimelate decarboxylase [Terriglobales bacterium]|jgi:diaminopimelate decarboxylase|nr:diaminopimelate decarboxylase [Terriglobales bacterium]
MSNRAAPEGRPPAFVYRRDVLHCDRAKLPELARKYGTPLYVYSAAAIRDRYRAFDRAFRGFPHTVCYSVKANSNLALLKMLAALGCGFDVVSGGELQRVLHAAKPAAKRVVFSGVGKTREEMDAALNAGILMFNVESESEMAVLAERAARLKTRAQVAFRVNPDVSAETHPYIATGLHKHKFGVPIDSAAKLYQQAGREKWLEVAGVSVHIGSQITRVEPFGAAMERVAELVRGLKRDGHRIRYVDAGGGLGIRYDAQELPGFADHSRAFAKAVTGPLRKLRVHLLLEPGRSIVGPAGALVVRVLYRKSNNGKLFVVVDGAMNDLIRPALYGAHHEIVPVVRTSLAERDIVDIVGPICETGDFFARDRELSPIEEGGLLAILDTGAYGMSITSNYNTRPRAAEVLVDGSRTRVIRKRETIADLLRDETR